MCVRKRIFSTSPCTKGPCEDCPFVPSQAIAAAFLATPESDQDEVQELYHRFLHRQADAAGLMVFENQLQHGVANEQVTAP